MQRFSVLSGKGLRVFGRKKEGQEAPASDRYYVETINMGAKFSPEKRARALQDALNAGDDKGWRLVSMETQGQSHVKIIIWDTNPSQTA